MNFFDFGEIITKDTDFVIFGIPWDHLTSKKGINSAIAPLKIREVSNNLALTTEKGSFIPKINATDVGDVKISLSNVDKNLMEIKAFIDSLYQQKSDIIPVMIGGDHFCTFSVIKVIGDNFVNKDELGVLIFDAHLDLYEKWDEKEHSHATVTHRIYDLDFINSNNLLIVGSRDVDIPEIKIANRENIIHLDAHELSEQGIKKTVEMICNFFKKTKVQFLYVSIDIDVLDPSIAPGTGYAIPGGLSYRKFWKILNEIAKSFNIIGFDMVEVAPNLDLLNNITSVVAAKLIVEFMSFIIEMKNI